MQELFDEPLAGHTTMRVGGPAARMVVAETPDELVDAVREVDDAGEPLLLLGGGSNLVVPDAGFECAFLDEQRSQEITSFRVAGVSLERFGERILCVFGPAQAHVRFAELTGEPGQAAVDFAGFGEL